MTLQEYVDFLRKQIGDGKIDPSLAVAVCANWNPRKDYWLLEEKDTTVEEYDDGYGGKIAIVTY